MAGRNGFPGLVGDFPRGTTIPLTFTFKDPDGNPVDVTNCKVYFLLSLNEDGTPVAIESVMSAADPVNGVIYGEMSDSETLALTANKYYYSLKFIDAAGRAFVFDQGKVKVFEAVNPRVEQ